jgi:D-beta-D-heptose 7-phosphate kinase / D-beta-D-heptose 1-phosphate adenosyltransferase
MDFLPDRFNQARVLVVGDIMLDRYHWGSVRRISPEAPVPVVQLQRTSETLGGAGNVALNLTGLGCQVTLIGLCGQDQRAETLKAMLDSKGVNHQLIAESSRPTVTKTRIMAHKQQVLRLDEEAVHAPAPEILQQVEARVTQALPHCQALILSDYGKGLYASDRLSTSLIDLAHRHARPVLVDPKGADWQRYRQATCITPNTAELEAVVGRALEEDEALLIDSAKAVRTRFGLQWLLVTRGPRGMCLLGPDDQVSLIAAQAREVYDVSGAGDTVVATLAAALACGVPFEQAVRAANTAAGIVVGKLGTQPILNSELSIALHYSDDQHYFPYSAAKICTLQGALAKVQEWRAAGDRVVFTNGCFDLLHPGHVSLLYQARAQGDRLIVGLNTDASVRRLKGPRRPILAEQDRAAILGALACVDLVVHFDEDTPLALIRAMRPDILVKGSDYSPEAVVGKSLVESYGGSVCLVAVAPGYSTTRIEEKVIGSTKENQG